MRQVANRLPVLVAHDDINENRVYALVHGARRALRRRLLAARRRSAERDHQRNHIRKTKTRIVHPVSEP
ncbi:MAG: hypothetical protein DMF84_30495 [Acidobacteria bacterium]|nr:MAG: hypothetical protein DMF84_30495 [Acidobacteriota bacterium]